MKKLDIKRALADHNMTQVQLGEKLNVFPQSLTSIIKGNPTVKSWRILQWPSAATLQIFSILKQKTLQKNYRQMIIKLNQYKRLSWRPLSFKQKLSAHIVVKE